MKIPRLSRITREEIPKLAGRASTTGHVMGQSPRKNKLTMMPGTNPKLFGGTHTLRTPKAGGLTQQTAPHKHEGDFFSGGFGQTGLTGES